MLQHRGKIFAVEQNEAYLDADGKDINASHLLGWNDVGELVAYARVLPPTETDPFVRFGRLSVALEHRGHGYGKRAVDEILAYIMRSDYSIFPIQISAQAHLTKIYEKFGFHAHGDLFNMGRIPHVKMDHPPLKKNLEERESPETFLSLGGLNSKPHGLDLFMSYKF